MRATLMFAACIVAAGCAAAPVAEEPAVMKEEQKADKPAAEPLPEVTAVPAVQDGVITKLRGVAYIHDVENEAYIVLRQGDRVPIGKIFYLTPKTTMKIEQGAGEGLYLYSKEDETYYRLELSRP